MAPASGRRSPASCPMSVVLPAPLEPMIACVSPRVTSRLLRSLASRPPKRLPRARLVRLRRSDDHAEPRRDQPVAEDDEYDEDRQHDVVEDGGLIEIDQPTELAADGEAHPVVAAVDLEADAQVVEHLGEGERDH